MCDHGDSQVGETGPQRYTWGYSHSLEFWEEDWLSQEVTLFHARRNTGTCSRGVGRGSRRRRRQPQRASARYAPGTVHVAGKGHFAETLGSLEV